MHELGEYTIPPCDVRGRFFDERGSTASWPSRLADATSQIDPLAVCSVLQFGAIVPPLSPWQGIRRFLPGYHYRGSQMIGPVQLDRHAPRSAPDPEQQVAEVERLVDTFLQSHLHDREDPVLLFSGGVDSGFIASRLAALGYRDSLLVNLSFGEDDPQSRLAESMADELGLKFQRIETSCKVLSCLVDPGQVYPQPFGDHTTAPVSGFACGAVNVLGNTKRYVLDGAGAEPAFCMTPMIGLMERASRRPAAAGKAAAFAHRNTLWYRRCKAEGLASKLRRSAEMPFLSSVLARSAVAATFCREISIDALDRLVQEWVGGWAGESPKSQILAALFALRHANQFAQKHRSILESAGHRMLSPFLDNSVLERALFTIPDWQMDEPKAPLKQSLAQHVPRDMVYRPKSPFVDPREDDLFTCSEFVDYLRACAEPSGPISGLLERRPLLKACDLLARGETLPRHTHNVLWAIVFMDRWYRTALPAPGAHD
jgi:asparagine synthase (glutamine-hydrolysing)